MTKANTATKTPTPVMRTSAGLRDAIFDELDDLRGGSSNPTRANAVAKLAGSIVETVRMEVEVQRFQMQHTAKKDDAPRVASPLNGGMNLGSH